MIYQEWIFGYKKNINKEDQNLITKKNISINKS